ncbi:MAG: hypothetical protein JWO06_1748 [Bacteroidota bacterium]|nr:hypothetical protein [Bacteroidota bacterium]
MKTKLIMFSMLFSIVAFGQDNKFSNGDFALRYGVYFNGAVNQQFTFGRIIKQNWEVGTTFSFSFTTHKNTNTDTTSQYYFGRSNTSLNREIDNSQTNFSFGLTPYMVYHFKTNNNLDIYTGPYLSLLFTDNGPLVTKTTLTGTNLGETEILTNYSPLSIHGGAGIILGCQYFFYKNLALGVQGSLGVTAGGTTGQTLSKDEIDDSGSQNAHQGYIVTRNPQHVSTFDASASLSGNIGINLTFYFAKKQKTSATSAHYN